MKRDFKNLKSPRDLFSEKNIDTVRSGKISIFDLSQMISILLSEKLEPEELIKLAGKRVESLSDDHVKTDLFLEAFLFDLMTITILFSLSEFKESE